MYGGAICNLPMECLSLTSARDAYSRLQAAAAAALVAVADSDDLFFRVCNSLLLSDGGKLIPDIQQPDAAQAHYFLQNAFNEPAEKPLSNNPDKDFQHAMNDFSPICPVRLSQPKFRDVERSEFLPPFSLEDLPSQNQEKCVNMSKCMASPVSASDTTVEDQPSNDSPDVQIIGENKFNVRCSQLSKKADGAYNSMVNRSFDRSTVTSLSHSHHISSSRRKKPPHGPRRVAFPAKYTSNSFVPQTNRFPISALERRYYTVFCRLGQSERYQWLIAITYRKVRCSYHSLGQSLMPGGRVNNFLISVFCRKLFDDCHPSISRKHFFFSYIGENILKYHNKDQFKLIRNAFKGASLAKKIDSCELLFFPICHCEHWFLFVVDLQDRLFAFLDSLYNKNSRYQVVVRGLLIGNFKHLWKELVDPEYSFDNFKIVYPAVPRQGNGNDCGVYVMKCMEIWTPKVVLHDYFSKDNIPNIRIQYANQLFFSPRNTVNKSLVTNFYKEGEFLCVRKSITSASNESHIARTMKK